MKKLISLFLAILMVFSVATFAFAEEVETPTGEEQTTTEELPGLGDIEDMPLWEAKLLLKVAKIAVKLIVAFVRVGVKLGFIEEEDVVAKVEELVGGAFGDLPIDIGTLIGIALI